MDTEYQNKEQAIDRYLADIREIKHTIAQVERRYRIGPEFYFITAALIALAGVVHMVLHWTAAPSVTQALLWVWLPFFLLVGLAEITSWLRMSNAGGITLFTPGFIRFVVSAAGTMSAIAALLVALLLSGVAAPGPVLLAVGPVLLFYSSYSNDAAVIGGGFLVAIGMVMWLAGASGFGWMVVAGSLCWAVFVVTGIYERRLRHSE